MQQNIQALRAKFDKLPAELKAAILSEETADSIREICEKNKVGENSISKVAELIGEVLMGIIPLEQIATTLRKRIKINKKTSQDISRGVNQTIIAPVKRLLFKKSNESVPTSPKQQAPKANDAYRESIS